MKSILLAALCAAAFLPARADTVAWWHFDEADPGTTAEAGTIASETTPGQYAEPWTIGDPLLPHRERTAPDLRGA